jgi:type II secretory pathway pseudopilin PulG
MAMEIKKSQFNLKSKRGFTLIEALIAISILIIGIVSSFILVTRALYNTNIIQDRLTASFLAQEGLELVRQIRDSNYLNKINGGSINWDNNLAPGTYRISFENGLEKIQSPNEAQLYFHDDSGLFNYISSDGKLTSFSRKINIEQISSDELKITTIINWQTKGSEYTIQVEDHLFNWLPL